jgi:hypothetical protein
MCKDDSPFFYHEMVSSGGFQVYYKIASGILLQALPYTFNFLNNQLYVYFISQQSLCNQ